MKPQLSIEENKDLFLDKMITFEKRYILQHYFEFNKTINLIERDILKKCPSSEIETNALIGVLLGDNDSLNIFRLRVESAFKSNRKLADSCRKLITPTMIKDAEAELFHYEYEYNASVEIPIIDIYIKLFVDNSNHGKTA